MIQCEIISFPSILLLFSAISGGIDKFLYCYKNRVYGGLKMARVKNEKFAIVCCNIEFDALKRFGVNGRNIYWIGNCNELFQRIAMGDTLCVCNVKSFAVGAYDLFHKMRCFSDMGIEFQSLNERFLNFSRSKPMQETTYQALESMANREHEFELWIQASKLNQDAKAQLISRLHYEFLTDIVIMFHNTGIKRRN